MNSYCRRIAETTAATGRVYLAGPPFASEYRRRAEMLVRDAGWEPVDPMRRDFRGHTEGREAEIVEGDLAEIASCHALLAAFTAPDEGTAMEAWYARTLGKLVVAYTGGSPPHPWTVYVADVVREDLEDAVQALARQPVSRALRLDHSVIAVSDWNVSNRFYRDVIGAELVPAGAGRVAYRLGDTQLNVHGPGVDISGNVARFPVRPGNSDLCFLWPGPIAEAITHLDRHSVEVETGPVERLGARGRGVSVYFRDPDGSLLEFIAYDGDAFGGA
jgi:catechol 2,3-dioxygenase-like lactoylglutathione lyase family enzyme/nucleoside 2-deoxyribosyltransferase